MEQPFTGYKEMNMKRIIRISIPVEVQVTLKDCELSKEEQLYEIILDLERQLNNLKLLSDVMPIGIHPRFHFGGNSSDYKLISIGNYDNESGGTNTVDK